MKDGSHGKDLSGADLHRANLSGADLLRANLIGVNLTDVYLNDANLTDAVEKGQGARSCHTLRQAGPPRASGAVLSPAADLTLRISPVGGVSGGGESQSDPAGKAGEYGWSP